MKQDAEGQAPGEQVPEKTDNAPRDPAETPKYWAFISYSHRDARWGDWLHRALETYRVPGRLVGRDSRDGKVPHRLFPFFRDREELPTSASLSENLQDALRRSRYLIVICSPHSAASRWVNEEVRSFKALGREDRVLCLIVDGEPNATDKPEGGMLECFPRAVCFRVGTDGELTHERIEPIAADARAGRDGKQNAKLKLLAGLLGVGFDELKQRERQRAQRRRALWTGFVIGLLLVVLGIWTWQRQLRLEQARHEQIAKLTEAGRQELLAGNMLRSAVYLSEAYRLGGADAPLRLMLGWVLRPLEAEVATLEGHTAAVNFAVYSPDGSRILTAADDGLAKVYSAQTHELVSTLTGHKWFVRSGGFGAGGRTVFTVGTEDAVKVWNAGSGELTTTLDGELAALGADGKRMVTAKDGQARLWEGEPPVPKTLEGRTLHLAAVVFSPDGSRLAGGGGLDADSPMPGGSPRGRIWNAASGKIVAHLEGHGGAINSVAYSPHGKLIATTSTDGTAKLWDAASGELLSSFGPHPESVPYAQFSPDSAWLLTISAQIAAVWDVTGKQTPAAVLVHEAWINSARYSPDGRRIVTAANDNSAYLWDAATGQPLLSLVGHTGQVHSAQFSPSGQFVVTASFDQRAKIWDVSRTTVSRVFPVERAASVAFSPDGKQLAVAGKQAEIWDIETGKRIGSIDAHPQWGVRHVAFSPDGKRLVTASEDRTCQVWETSSGAQVSVFRGHDARVMSARFSADGLRVVSAALDHTAKVWQADTGSLIQSIRCPTGQAMFADFNPRGDQVIVALGSSSGIWDVATGELKVKLSDQAGAVSHAMFSRDGKRLVTAGGDVAHVCDAASGKLLASLVGHRAQVNRAALNPEGSLIATAANDRTVRLWDAKDGKLLLVLEHPASEVHAVEFSPDGQSVASSSDGTVRVWDLRAETRGPRFVADLVRRRVPLKVVEGRLVPR